MRAPVAVSPTRYNELVAEFLKNECYSIGQAVVHKACIMTGMSNNPCKCDKLMSAYACMICGNDISWIPVPMSVHTSSCPCTGFGDVVWPGLPTCNVCEPDWKNYYGCIHISPGVVLITTEVGFELVLPSPFEAEINHTLGTLLQRFKARLFR